MGDVSRVKTKGKTLVDPVVETPVDRYQIRARRRNVIILILVALIVVVLWLAISRSRV